MAYVKYIFLQITFRNMIPLCFDLRKENLYSNSPEGTRWWWAVMCGLDVLKYTSLLLIFLPWRSAYKILFNFESTYTPKGLLLALCFLATTLTKIPHYDIAPRKAFKINQIHQESSGIRKINQKLQLFTEVCSNFAFPPHHINLVAKNSAVIFLE